MPGSPHLEAGDKAGIQSSHSRYGWVILGVIFLILFIAVSSRGIVTMYVRPWSSEFGWSITAITLAMSIQLLFSGPGGILGGNLTDRFGPKNVLIGYLLLIVIGVLGIAAMNGLWQLYLFYGLFLGIGSMLHPVTTPLIARWFSKGRGLALGMVQEGDLLGMAVLAPFLLIINETSGWRTAWFGMGLATLVLVIPMAWLFIKPVPAKTSVGTKSANPVTTPPGATLRQASHHRSFWMLMVTTLFCGVTARYFWLLIAPIALEGGMSPTQVGLTISIAGIMAVPGMLVFGFACDRISRPLLLSINFMLRCVAFIIMSLYIWNHQPLLMFIGAGMAGFLTRSSAPPFSLAWINCFGFRSIGTIFGVSSTVHQTAAALSLFMAGYIFDRVGSYLPTLISSAVLLVIVSIVAWRIPEKKCYIDTPEVVQPEKSQRLVTNAP